MRPVAAQPHSPLALLLLRQLLHLLLRLAGELLEAHAHALRVLHELFTTPLHALRSHSSACQHTDCADASVLAVKYDMLCAEAVAEAWNRLVQMQGQQTKYHQ